jgi:hypothetical protein
MLTRIAASIRSDMLTTRRSAIRRIGKREEEIIIGS